jgi:hypothetical protein
MLHHPKTYEDVFSSDLPSNKNSIKTEHIKIDVMETEEYCLLFKSFLKDFYTRLFDDCVKLSWLRRKFTYAGQRAKMPLYSSSRMYHGKFIKYLRRYIGHDIQVVTKGYFYTKLETYYFDTFFPGFEEGNPFTNPDYYKFPYENITFEYLTTVYQLDDRFDLLKEADKRGLNYAEFLDYVLNHTLSENERLGRDRYHLEQGLSRVAPYFFRDSDKHFKAQRGEKRL